MKNNKRTGRFWLSRCIKAGNGAFLGMAVFTIFFAETRLFSAENSECAAEGCLWGGVGERTTYQEPYSELLAPEIPVEQKKDPNALAEQKYPMRPEDAIAVITADGRRYSYYYKKGTGFRKFVEYRTVFEPEERLERREIEEFNPCTGQIELRSVVEPVRSTFPTFHEKEFVRWEPVEGLIRVIIPCEPSPPVVDGMIGPGTAATHFSTSVPEK